MVGEIHDGETAEIAVRSARSGGSYSDRTRRAHGNRLTAHRHGIEPFSLPPRRRWSSPSAWSDAFV